MALIGEKYDLGHVFYVDLWPMANSFLIIQDPDVAAQLTQTRNHPTHILNKEFLRNMTGEKSIVTSEGVEWKMLRSMLGPVLSLKHLSTIIPDITEHVLVFRDSLQKLAEDGQVFPMQGLVSTATLDVISQRVLGRSLNVQTQFSSIADNFYKTMSWAVSSTDPISRMKSILPMWWNCRQLDRELSAEIRERHASVATDSIAQKTVVDLAFQAYQDNKLGNHPSDKPGKADLDPEFMRIAVNNVKTMLLGGHDTTATTIAYAYYLLSLHPTIVSQLRSEHSDVLSPSLSETATLLKSATASKLLTKLPLTTAVLKETLRLFPAGSTFRASLYPSETISYQSQQLPLTNHGIWISHYDIGRRGDLFPNPLEFNPARFLPNSPISPPKDAWRPFEKGPRNCLGQELAMLEMKIVLVLTVRGFEFESAYGEGRGEGEEAPGEHGGRAYQMIALAPKPARGMPMRVSMRGRGEERRDGGMMGERW